MKILFFEWDCYAKDNWKEALIQQGHVVDCVAVQDLSDENNREFIEKIEEAIKENQYEALCSFNFFPILAIAAWEAGCKYISWVYDSPALHVHSKEVFYPGNYVFLFDRVLYESLRKKGVTTVYYLPLAGVADMQRYLKDMPLKEKQMDITFVGSLYQKKNFYDQIKYLPEKLKGYLDGCMASQRKISGYYMIPELLTDRVMEEIEQYVSMELGEHFWAEKREIFSSLFMAQKLANMERISILRALTPRFTVHLYSSDRLEEANVVNCGTVPYGKEMYQMFHNSKININSTLRCIQSGINLRTMDILSAGGFCLTNYQPELELYFDIGKDLVVYENEEDLLEKVTYYLKHEEERQEIAGNGKRRIEEAYNYQKRVREMMGVVLHEKRVVSSKL